VDEEEKTYKHKGKYTPAVGADLSGLNEIVLDSMSKNLGGRPCRYENNKIGLERFTQKTYEFFQRIAELNAEKPAEQCTIPSIELWALFLGCDRNTILNYAKRGGEWASTISYFKNAIAAFKLELGSHGKIPSLVLIFDLVNNGNYFNTNEFKPGMNEPGADSNTGKIEQKLSETNLVWDSELNDFVQILEVDSDG
jgi:hypothetical protein